MSLEKKEIEVILASPPEYTRLVAEIFYDGKFIALISQERGEGIFDIETPGFVMNEFQVLRKIAVNDLQRAISMACEKLSK